MIKIDIISGFLGAGKTTLIKKLIKEELGQEKLVLIENEFGEIGIDGGFLQEAGIEIKEMNSGCICCSLVGDFAQALEKVIEDYHPERILIEPSGVGKLSDVVKAVMDLKDENLKLNSLTTVVDGNKCKSYMKNFGEFFNNQIEHAHTIVVSRSQTLDKEKLQNVVEMLQEHNENAHLIITPWDKLSAKQIITVMEEDEDLTESLMKDMDICPICHQHEEGHSHHHDGEHHHHHEDGCSCGHDHDHHEHHHADEVFTSWGKESAQLYREEQLHTILEALSNQDTYGTILRAKGMVEGEQGTWLYFDFVPEEFDIRKGEAMTIGKLCVIGSNLKEEAIEQLFKVGKGE